MMDHKTCLMVQHVADQNMDTVNPPKIGQRSLEMTRTLTSVIVMAVTCFFSLATVASAATLYSEDFEGTGTLTTDFGYTAPLTGANVVATGPGLGTKVAKLQQNPAIKVQTFAIATLPTTGIITLRADAWMGTSGGVGYGGLYGLGMGAAYPDMNMASSSGTFIGSRNGPSWSMDNRGLTGGAITYLSQIATSPTAFGSAVVLELLLNLDTGDITGSVIHSGGTDSFTENIPNLATQLGLVTYFGLQGSAAGDTELDNLLVTHIPEPASLALLGLGGLMMVRRQRRTVK